MTFRGINSIFNSEGPELESSSVISSGADTSSKSTATLSKPSSYDLTFSIKHIAKF